MKKALNFQTLRLLQDKFELVLGPQFWVYTSIKTERNANRTNYFGCKTEARFLKARPGPDS
jgi:hypothetical protein